MKKSEIKKLDIAWSKKVKERANFRCEYCFKSDGCLNSAHIIGRRYRSTRWGAFINNKYDLCGMCLCKYHHDCYDEHLPDEYNIRKMVIGEERYMFIRSVSVAIAKKQFFDEILKNINEYR